MARTLAALPAGSRITDYISLGVIAKFFPAEKVRQVLQQTNRDSIRERDLPAHVVVYYVIALALYMRSSYREVLRCPAGRCAVAAGSFGAIESCRQVRHFAGTKPSGCRAGKEIV
jgi:hypothetical protein